MYNSKKPLATIMVDELTHTIVVTNGQTYGQERVDPMQFAKSNHNRFHSSKDCTVALLKLVEADCENFEATITPTAAHMISKIYVDSLKLH